MGKLKDKRVVIIGGTAGIGLGVAHAAAAEGAKIVTASSSAQKVEKAKAALPAGTEVLTLNVRDEKQIEDFFNKVGKFDHLIYTAGDWPLPLGSDVTKIDMTAIKQIYEVRFWCALACVKHAVSKIDPNGSITLTDGAMGLRPRKNAAVLSTMAAAVEHLARALSLDLAPIRVNAVAPGVIETPLEDPTRLAARVTTKERLKTTHPLGRMGQMDEVAEAYLYLMKGGYTNGQVLYVEGGQNV